jgi:hypothetical protein
MDTTLGDHYPSGLVGLAGLEDGAGEAGVRCYCLEEVAQ